MKPKKIKARKMWGSAIATPTVLLFSTKTTSSVFSGSRIAPVAVLPADAASVEAMVEQMAQAAYHCAHPKTKLPPIDRLLGEAYRKIARAALAAIGIKGGKL